MRRAVTPRELDSRSESPQHESTDDQRGGKDRNPVFSIQLSRRAQHIVRCPLDKTPHNKALITRDDPCKYRTQKRTTPDLMGERMGARARGSFSPKPAKKTCVSWDTAIKLDALANR